MANIHEALEPLTVPIDDLIQDPANARTHDPRNIEAIAASLERFGQTKPVVLHKNGKTIIAGNGTWQAAKRLGWTRIAATRTTLTSAEAIAYGIADNKTAELAAWEDDTLRNLIGGLPEELQLATGFDDKEIEDLLRETIESVEEDEIPETPEEAKTKTGDLWILGEHRLLCGDSNNDKHVARLMDGKRADVVFTDPPYALFGNSTGVEGVADDKMVRPFFRDIFTKCKNNVVPYGHVYVCCDWHSVNAIENSAREVELAAKNLIVWDKGDGGVGGTYQNCHELVWFFSNSLKQTTTTKSRKQGRERPVHGRPNIWRFPRVPTGEREHNAAKPVEMIQVPIEASSDRGDLVLDLFLGSGSTLIAADKIGRRCFGMEIDAKCCDIIVERWERQTGKKAERQSGGE